MFRKLVKGVVWDYSSRIVIMLIRVLISIYLTRLLEPEQFGIFGAIMVFLAISQSYIDLGLAGGLIQTNKNNKELYSSVFWVNIMIGFILFTALYFSSSLISNFYNYSILAPVGQALSIIILFESTTVIHRVTLSKKIDFRALNLISLVAMVISGGVAIWMAYNGYGIWSLVFNELISSFIRTVIFWVVINWKPSFVFNFREVKEIMGFSTYKFLISLMNSIYSRIDYLIITKIMPAAFLGFYVRAKSLDRYFIEFSSGSLSKVFFPTVSAIQSKVDEVFNLYRRVFKLTAILSIFLSGLLFTVANELFILLFTEKWLTSAHLFKLMAVGGYTYALSAIMVNLLMGMGHSKKNFYLGLKKKFLGLIALSTLFYLDVHTFLIIWIVVANINLVLNMFECQKILKVSVKDNLKLIYPPFFSGLAATTTIALINSNLVYLVMVKFIVNTLLYSIIFFVILYLLNPGIGKFVKEYFQRTSSKVDRLFQGKG